MFRDYNATADREFQRRLASDKGHSVKSRGDRGLSFILDPIGGAELARRMREVADSHLSRLAQPSFSSELRAVLRARLEDGPRDADSIAAELHMGLRTLQRRLEAEGTAFSEVLDGARREVALELIETDLPVRDLATRCGFSGSRALIRAFRRWTGSTPAAYREGTRGAMSRSTEPSRS